jgi:Derlin-2/3
MYLPLFSASSFTCSHNVVRYANPTSKLTSGFYLGDALLLQPLILAFAYTFAQENPNANVSMYIITFPAKYLPFALLFITLVMASPTAAMHQATGLIAAHLYDFLTRIWPTFGGGTNYIITPNFVKNWFIEPGPPRPQARSYGTAYEPGQRAPPGNTSWSHQRGPGRRLGGD